MKSVVERNAKNRPKISFLKSKIPIMQVKTFYNKNKKRLNFLSETVAFSK